MDFKDLSTTPAGASVLNLGSLNKEDAIFIRNNAVTFKYRDTNEASIFRVGDQLYAMFAYGNSYSDTPFEIQLEPQGDTYTLVLMGCNVPITGLRPTHTVLQPEYDGGL